MHRTRNAAWVQAHRGFESPPLRHTSNLPKKILSTLNGKVGTGGALMNTWPDTDGRIIARYLDG